MTSFVDVHGVVLANIPAVEKKAAGSECPDCKDKSNPHRVPRSIVNTTLNSIHLESYELVISIPCDFPIY